MFARPGGKLYALAMKHELYVMVGLDVEEEGLFGGTYRNRDVGVDNVSLLPRLAPISEEFGLPLTLFCAYPVFMDPVAQKTVARMRDAYGAEVGAHLHHWSTPPLGDGEIEGEPARTHAMPAKALEEKLLNLLQVGRIFNGKALTSFRMGRWDLKSSLLPMLAQNGIKVDSSICPLRTFKNGPDHFYAPADPYWLKWPGGHILEAPITQLPIARSVASIWGNLWRGNAKMRDRFHFFGALSANPLWHDVFIMRLATRLHVARGGRLLNFFWHSSEMMPGGSPHIKTALDAEKLLKRIFSFCGWLRANYEVRGITATELSGLGAEASFPEYALSQAEDWR